MGPVDLPCSSFCSELVLPVAHSALVVMADVMQEQHTWKLRAVNVATHWSSFCRGLNIPVIWLKQTVLTIGAIGSDWGVHSSNIYGVKLLSYCRDVVTSLFFIWRDWNLYCVAFLWIVPWFWNNHCLFVAHYTRVSHTKCSDVIFFFMHHKMLLIM